ncbi:MAG: Transcriptional regulator YqjI [Legionella sp.]|uniref:PadR family transcriptional regulator n=1 Tax=Legionella sp. TaxID=459 RepID=UPI003D101498
MRHKNRPHNRNLDDETADFPDFERPHTNKRSRFFESGHLKLLILHLLSKDAKSGYDLIREIEGLAGGKYIPSSGVIYPVLMLLQESQHISVAEHEGSRKKYAITESGTIILDENHPIIERIFYKLQLKREFVKAQRPPQIIRAMHNLKTAIVLKLESTNHTEDMAYDIAKLIDQAAIDIERL